MTSAKQQVFVEKVLKRLYPSVSNQQLQATTETSSSKPELEPSKVQSKADDENKIQPKKKIYTVSPPPDGYVPHSPEFTDTRKSEKSSSTDDSEEENPQEPRKRRRRRRKQKPKNILQSPHNIHVEQTEFEKNKSRLQEKLQPQHTDGPQISKNKKRKLKKKQQKERKRAAGLLTRATAITFTYQPESNSEEEEEDFKGTEEKADGILDFLQATQEIYFSDSNVKSSGSIACLETIQEIFKHLEFHRIASSDIILLHQMKTLVLLQDIERLKSALEQFQEQCMMPPDHAREIATLFHYWITDILPIRNRSGGPSTKS